MAIYYIYHPEGFNPGTACRPGLKEVHHLLRVLRATARDRFFVFDGTGTVGRCSLQCAEPNHCALAVEEVVNFPPPRPLALLQGVVKNAAMDQIIHQAAELGVTQIFPIVGANGVVSTDGAHMAKRLERWRQIAIEACKQSKNPFLPQILPPRPLGAALETLSREMFKIVAALGENCQPWAKCVSRVSSAESIAVAIGPEGDFSGDEYATLVAADFFPLTLGQRVLTTQTAAVALLGTIQQTYCLEKSPAHLVGMAGFEPAASTSRT
ncbi:MAG: 16S rRNA (uracil(1498)-N(3))-methyltransferase [Puniceicoccales bacterium]|nr:16S rRNA (uracil(1498)-N(3))-methyltransferase [Puniceicoccales bacterium]